MWMSSEVRADDEAEPASAVAANGVQQSKGSARRQSRRDPKRDASKDIEQPATSDGTSWEVSVDAAWAKRNAERIAARSAATDAAKVLGAPKLSASEYPTLQKLLAASTLLQLNWRREGNYIFRK